MENWQGKLSTQRKPTHFHYVNHKSHMTSARVGKKQLAIDMTLYSNKGAILMLTINLRC
jgi:hypothetical protein